MNMGKGEKIDLKKKRIFFFRVTGWIWKHKFFIAFMILLVIICDLRYQRLLHRLPYYKTISSKSFKKLTYPHLSREQVVMLGGAHTKNHYPGNSYIQFPRTKGPEVIRIGIFGCSFVYGAEAAYGHDFPTLLQRRFEQAGMKNVEVINFGLGGRGVHQMYLLWQYIGKEINLDYVVMMPLDIHMRRDESFCNSYIYNQVYARYILDGEGLKLVPVVGETQKETIQNYYSFFTCWRYIRYDNKMPMFMRVLLPSSFHERTNPFYYKLRKFNKGEIPRTYVRIFSKMAEEVDKLIILTEGQIVYNLKDKLQVPNVYFFKGKIRHRYHLYGAPRGHNSSLGNQLIADQLFSLFSGREKHPLTLLELSGINRAYLKEHPLPPSSFLPLYEYKEVYLSIGENRLGSFITGVRKKLFQGKGENADFKNDKVASLILVEDFIDGKDLRFFQWPSLLTGNLPVYLSFRVEEKKFEFPIGSMIMHSNINGELDLKLPGEIEANDMTLRLKIKKKRLIISSAKKPHKVHKIKNVSIKMDNQVLLKGILISKKKSAKRQVFSFIPTIFEFVYLRATMRQYLDVLNYKNQKGSLDLVLVDQQDNQTRLPFLLFEKKTEETLNIEPPPFPVNILEAKTGSGEL